MRPGKISQKTSPAAATRSAADRQTSAKAVLHPPVIQRFNDPDTNMPVDIDTLSAEQAGRYINLHDTGKLPMPTTEYTRLLNREIDELRARNTTPYIPPDPSLIDKVNTLTEQDIGALTPRQATAYLLLESAGVRIRDNIFRSLIKREMGKDEPYPKRKKITPFVPAHPQPELSAEALRANVAAAAKTSAIDILGRAIALLQVKSTDPQVQEHIKRVFHDPSLVLTLQDNLSKMKHYLEASQLKISYDPDSKSSGNAFTLNGEITLVKRFFDNLNDGERANTVIHESVHASLKVPDFAYTTERLITALNQQTALRNPDSYVWFLAGLLENRITPKDQLQDIFAGEGTSQDRKFEVAKSLGLQTAALIKVSQLFQEAADDTLLAISTGRAGNNNTKYVVQEIKKVFTGSSQSWNADKPTENMQKGLATMATIFTFLMGGLVTPVRITTETGLPEPVWHRKGTEPSTLRLPAGLHNKDLYKTLMPAYVRDLLPSSKPWKNYYNLILSISPQFVNLGDYIGVQMEALEKLSD
jgi:hypothetical protein